MTDYYEGMDCRKCGKSTTGAHTVAVSGLCDRCWKKHSQIWDMDQAFRRIIGGC